MGVLRGPDCCLLLTVGKASPSRDCCMGTGLVGLQNESHVQAHRPGAQARVVREKTRMIVPLE